MIELQDHPEGCVLPVRAQPGARDNALRGIRAGALCVAVTQVAEKGKANAAISAVLASALGLRKSQLELLSGETNPQKKFLVRGVTPETLRAALAAALA